ncbi:hypothetical protein PR048_003785 [Dryococelus australis]|uniref:Uncharacterized protein n=1 Tax=Dryococelus australis TaxID=614101 RepID=A0ABQ9IP47_9NEOP|nr:hypothetical protein PR048_003785 [Dryococelus australis]
MVPQSVANCRGTSAYSRGRRRSHYNHLRVNLGEAVLAVKGDLPSQSTLTSTVPMTMGEDRKISSRGGRTVSPLPPIKANRVQSPAGSPDFRMWESCRTMPLVSGSSRGSPASPALSFGRCSIPTSITVIGSQDLAVKRRPNLFTSLGETPAERRDDSGRVRVRCRRTRGCGTLRVERYIACGRSEHSRTFWTGGMWTELRWDCRDSSLHTIPTLPSYHSPECDPRLIAIINVFSTKVRWCQLPSCIHIGGGLPVTPPPHIPTTHPYPALFALRTGLTP